VNASFVPIYLVDMIGSFCMILLAFLCLRLVLRLRSLAPKNIIWTYLLWLCYALSIFAVSRSVGHILKQLLLMTRHAALWTDIQPYSGAVNSFTFMVVGAVTLFFERSWQIYQQIARDKQALQVAHTQLLDLNQNLESRVRERTTALTISEAKYRRIFEGSRDMIAVVDGEGRILDLNPAGKRLLSLHDDDVIVGGIEFQRYLAYKRDWERLKVGLEGDGAVSSMEMDIVLPDGASRRTLLSGSLAEGPGDETVTIHLLIKDIEQQRRMHEQMAQAEKLASIGELSAGVAHEINNPLGIILGYTQLMIRGESDRTERFQDLKTIEKHVRHCQSIVGDLLKFARSSPPKRRLVDIHTLIDEVLQLVQYQGDLAQITIRKVYDDRVPELHLDAKKIKQVLLNLIINASYAMGRQGTLTLSTGLNPSGDSVILDIKDTGCGIQSKDLPRIFDPFYTTKPTDQGTGLGLSVSYGIIKNHGGDISVSSWAGEGTTFSILLPLPLGHGEASARTVSGHPDFKDDHIVDAEAAGEKDTGS
jgi:two-component system, NtrC family, sensor kinase